MFQLIQDIKIILTPYEQGPRDPNDDDLNHGLKYEKEGAFERIRKYPFLWELLK